MALRWTTYFHLHNRQLTPLCPQTYSKFYQSPATAFHPRYSSQLSPTALPRFSFRCIFQELRWLIHHTKSRPRVCRTIWYLAKRGRPSVRWCKCPWSRRFLPSSGRCWHLHSPGSRCLRANHHSNTTPARLGRWTLMSQRRKICKCLCGFFRQLIPLLLSPSSRTTRDNKRRLWSPGTNNWFQGTFLGPKFLLKR